MDWGIYGRKNVWAQFKVLFQNLHGRTDRNHKKLSKDNQCPGKVSEQMIPKYKPQV
jgi:hypothetical protein